MSNTSPLEAAPSEIELKEKIAYAAVAARHGHKDWQAFIKEFRPVECLRMLDTIKQQAAELAALKAQLPRAVEMACEMQRRKCSVYLETTDEEADSLAMLYAPLVPVADVLAMVAKENHAVQQ